MSLPQFDWSRFIDEIADIPFDVVFEIVDKNDGNVYDIKCHKIVVGLVSPTFKLMFYTTDVGDKTAQKITILGTTRTAFQIIIDVLYKVKSIKDSLQDKPLREVFDVINLIERYQMADLQKLINEFLTNYPVTDDTVLEVAAEAIHQTRLFQKEAQLLLLTCLKFLKQKLNDVNKIFKYVEENEDQKELVATLLARMSGLTPTGCFNCGYDDCHHGKPVREEEFREGLLVTNNPDAKKWWGPKNDFGTAIVTRVDGQDRVTIKHVKDG